MPVWRAFQFDMSFLFDTLFWLAVRHFSLFVIIFIWWTENDISVINPFWENYTKAKKASSFLENRKVFFK